VTGDELLDSLATDVVFWFFTHHNKENGLVMDRGYVNGTHPTKGSSSTHPRLSSIAATGYHLSMLPIAFERHCHNMAKETAIRTMKFVLNKVDHQYGILPHFLDVKTGAPWKGTEYSTLDTAIFLNGCMVCAQAFGLHDLADTLLNRIAWDKLVTRNLLSLGIKDDDVLAPSPDHTCEILMPYLLAVGSGRVDAKLWENSDRNWDRLRQFPLFTCYYGMGWADLEGKQDSLGVDFWSCARTMSLAQRRMSEKTWWGRSAGDTPAGYRAQGLGNHDGTVMPMASIAAVPWIPDEMDEDIRKWADSHLWSQVRGVYGLKNFNLSKNWFGDEVVAIDLGCFYLNWMNHKTGRICDLWGEHPVGKKALAAMFTGH